MLKSIGSVPADVARLSSGQFTVQMTGIDAPATTWDWSKNGNIVTLKVRSGGVSTSNGTNLEIPAGTLPVSIRPDRASYVPCPVVDNNTIRIGRADVPSVGAGAEGGVLFGLPDVTGSITFNGFTATGLKGMGIGTTLMYSLI